MAYDYEAIAKNLQRRGFIPHITQTAEELKKQLLEMIDSGSVGFGGSSGVNSLGIYDALKARGNEVWWHWKEEDKKLARTKMQTCVWFVCSANALTLAGQIIQIDGTGNRVAAQIHGTQKVIVIAGSNKIAKDIESGIEQIRSRVCPGNARRLKLNTPCAKTDKCAHCLSDDSMCRVIAILDQPTRAIKEFHVFLLKEPLGL